MSFFPDPSSVPYNLEAEDGTAFGLHLDLNFAELSATINQLLTCVQLIERDDGYLRNGSVTPDSFDGSALAFIAGTQNGPTRWIPRGRWATATVYEATDIVEVGSAPATAYVCVTAHVSSASFFVDHSVDHLWVVLSAPRTLVSSDVTSALGYTPVNKAGDTMTGALVAPTGTTIAGVAFTTPAIPNAVALDGAIYVNYAEAASDDAYGFLADIVRTASAGAIGGARFRAFGTTGNPSAFAAQALGLATNTGATLQASTITVSSFEPNNASPKIGNTYRFEDRLNSGDVAGSYSYALPTGTLSSVGGGLSPNKYNARAIAVLFQTQAPSATGEFCGWTRGLKFDEYSLDSETDATYPGSRAYPIGIDFSELHYYGGTDPVTSYNLEAAIALRGQQSIWWNRVPSAPNAAIKVRTFWDIASGRWVITGNGIEKFGVDTVTGEIYKNGSAIGGVTLAGNNIWTGTNDFNNAVSIAANLTFNGNGRRIKGDFTNSPITNRTSFQTSVAGSATEIQIIPSVGGGDSGVTVFTDPALTGGAYLRMAIGATQALLESGRIGAGVYLPLSFYTSGSERVRIGTAGEVLINTTSAPVTGAKLRVNGIAQIDNPVAFSVNRGGTAFNVAHDTITAVVWTAEAFDTNANFDLGTGRFTPPAGYYHMSGTATQLGTVDDGIVNCAIYKNGSILHSGGRATAGSYSLSGCNIAATIYANGTDYFDFRVYQANPSSSTLSFAGDSAQLFFTGHRVG